MSRRAGLLCGGAWWYIMCHEINSRNQNTHILIVVKHIAYMYQSLGFKSQRVHIPAILLIPKDLKLLAPQAPWELLIQVATWAGTCLFWIWVRGFSLELTSNRAGAITLIKKIKISYYIHFGWLAQHTKFYAASTQNGLTFQFLLLKRHQEFPYTRSHIASNTA